VKPIIRIAAEDDTDAVIRFINEHWRRDHILAHARHLFDWQHLSSTHPGELNFVVALDGGSNELLGILGFIPTSQFSLRPDWTDLRRSLEDT
jgi:hypothetical protein